ncbi:MAG: transglutaminase domain-containing protein [Methanomassiliicoccales archaeon]|nr:transglutaminase domain-containing protein [Methanomassiliicoccales archaeon]NYT15482.1 transglutaminase domain-containing protein [Methanomassiliicoccales archaeon]
MTGKGATKALIALLIAAVVISSGCLSSSDRDETGDSIFTSAMNEYLKANYRTASALFEDASQAYSLEGEVTRSIRATNWKFICQRMTLEFPFTRAEAEVLLEEAFPNMPRETRNAWLDNDSTEKLISDGEVLYYEQFIQNIRFRNLELIREMMEGIGHTPIYDSEAIRNIVWNATPLHEGPYLNPIQFHGWGNLSVPRDELPENGTLELWIPHPVTTSSQVNVKIVSIEPWEYIVHQPDVYADLGLAYLEIPLNEIKGDLEVTIEFTFTEYEMRFSVDPEEVGEYDEGSSEYIHYTRTSENIVVDQEIRELALSIVGNETNPYLQAQKIYWYVVDNIPYSLVPHLYLSTAGIPESQYVHEMGHGDCGAQSSYFCALCRSIGIPARDIGGNQLVPGTAGNHFWAEFLVPNYGWVPADVTIAEIADWSFDATDEERTTFKEFYFDNLDPYRFIIQKDFDIPMNPDPVNAILFRTVHQAPSAVCLTSQTDVELTMYYHWEFDIDPIGGEYTQ